MDVDVTGIPSGFLYKLFQHYACDLIKIGNDKKDGYLKKMEFLAPWLIKVEKELTLREMSNGGVMKSLVEHFNLSEALFQDAVEVNPDQNEENDFEKNPSSGGVSIAEAECQNTFGDEDSPTHFTMRVAKSIPIGYRPGLEITDRDSGSRPNRNRYRNHSRSVPNTPWLYSNIYKSVIKLPGKHWKVRYEDPPPPKRRKKFWTFRET